MKPFAKNKSSLNNTVDTINSKPKDKGNMKREKFTKINISMKND